MWRFGRPTRASRHHSREADRPLRWPRTFLWRHGSAEKPLTIEALGKTIGPGDREDGMTKSELIEALAPRGELTKARAEMVVACVFDAMIQALQRGEGIEIRGFGSFTVR